MPEVLACQEPAYREIAMREQCTWSSPKAFVGAMLKPIALLSTSHFASRGASKSVDFPRPVPAVNTMSFPLRTSSVRLACQS